MANTQWRDERKAIEKRFTDAWGNTTPIQYENVESAEQLTAPYVALSLLRGEGFQASLGDSPLLRYVGVIAIQIFGPSSKGPKDVEELADQAASIWLGTKGAPVQFASGTGGWITCKVPFLSEARKTGGFWMVTVTVPFERDQNIVQ